MTYAAFPSSLSGMLSIGKVRTTGAQFLHTAAGEAQLNIANLGATPSTVWQFRLRLSASDMQVFRLWFEDTLRDGKDWFTIDIDTEFGLVNHTCRFAPNSMSMQSEGGVYTFSATIYTPRLETPDVWVAVSDFVVGQSRWVEYFSYPDIAINKEWPH